MTITHISSPGLIKAVVPGEYSMQNKNSVKRKINFIWMGSLFAVFYWILESVRDVLTFEKGDILHRIFMPDPMAFWMRILVVCILILFSVRAHIYQNRAEDKKQTRRKIFSLAGIIKAGIIFCLLYWFLESVRDWFIFQKGSLLQEFFTPEPMGFWMRLLAICIIVLFSLYAQSFMEERKRAESELRKAHEELERVVNLRTEELSRSNVLLREEITERNRIEEQLRTVNRELKTISECNQIIVRTNDEASLLRDICQVLIRMGGYRLAWVVFEESDTSKILHPTFQMGYEKDELDVIDLVCKSMNDENHPIADAIQNVKYCVRRMTVADEAFEGWTQELCDQGFASFISLPLTNNFYPFGALNLFTSDPDAFTDDEINLLVELASDLAFGIIALRTRGEHQRAEQEKEKIYAQLLQAQKMEAIGILAGGIAHDFNNLLTAIQVSADLSMMQVNEKNPLYKELEEINIVAGRAADLARQLLIFSRKHPMEPRLLHLNTVIQNLLKMLYRLIGEEIKINTALTENLWSLKADRGTIEQVIMNLALNAKDAMEDGGELTIQTENVIFDDSTSKTISEARSGKFIKLSVMDDGKGMDKTTIQNIFDPFFSTKGQARGTGLGLSVVYGIVKQHNGWISVKSKKNKGTTFDIYLPAHEKVEIDDGVITKSDFKPNNGDGKEVLFIEDEKTVRDYVSKGLIKNGYRVYSASSASEAMNIFEEKQDKIEMIISDVVLPDSSGLELVDKLLCLNPKLHVLLSSGYTEQKSQWDKIKKKGFRYLPKPYALNDLLKAIEDMNQ